MVLITGYDASRGKLFVWNQWGNGKAINGMPKGHYELNEKYLGAEFIYVMLFESVEFLPATNVATHLQHADGAAVPARPDLVADVFGRHFVVGAGDFDVAVAARGAPGFLVAGEEACGQWLQMRAFFFEERSDLAAGGAVDAFIGGVTFPLLEVVVFRLQAGEASAFQGVVAHVIDAAFHLAFMPGNTGLAWHDADAVEPAEVGH